MTFGYGDSKVLHDISVSISDPGLVCIVGPNGVGKSTLVKCLVNILGPSSGTVRIGGEDIGDIRSDDLAKAMSYVPPSSVGGFSMTVMDTVLMGRHPYQKLGQNSRKDVAIARRVLNMLGLSELSMRLTSELSAGQLQKVAIARGLCQTPRILFLDEPTSNLDIRHQVEVTQLLRDICTSERMSVVMISHDLNIASRFADKVIMMSSPGVIRSFGTPGEVITSEAIEEVYGVDCEIVSHRGRPHVMIGDPISKGV
ncbi:MAG: ABC transporter ATP-binding protein [archaeon]|nr:ABC transporter ATP-binding protein [archaeon]